jgi:hypothetical protein
MPDKIEIFKVKSFYKDCGKKFKTSKRILTWRFGLATPFEGSANIEEHEITLIWSMISGKRFVLLDGKQRHFSQGMMGMMEKFHRKWNWNGLKIEIIAHASRPIRRVDHRWVQYDMKINDTSFRFLPAMDRVCINGHQIRPSEIKKIYEEDNDDTDKRTTDPSEVENIMDMPSANDDFHSIFSHSSHRSGSEDDQSESQHSLSLLGSLSAEGSSLEKEELSRADSASTTSSMPTEHSKTSSSRQGEEIQILPDDTSCLTPSYTTGDDSKNSSEEVCSFGLELCSLKIMKVSCL